MWIQILIIFNSIFFLSSNKLSYEIDSNKYLGDSCAISSEINGTCVKANDCTSIKKGSNFKTFVRCEFQFNTFIICCPIVEQATIEDTTFPDNYELSSRFNAMLCENTEPELKVTQNIVGGSEAGVGEFPYQVVLGYLSNSTIGGIEFKCGGSLIANDIVITAAHCVNLKKDRPVVVRLGRTSLIDDEDDYGAKVDVGIKKIIYHKEYNKMRKANDIALIKLKEAVTYTDHIKPICLSKNEEIWGQNLTVTGFGVVNTTTQKTSQWLMKATIQEYDFDECKNIYNEQNFTIYKSQLCAIGLKGADACTGDSGGPLIYEKDSKDHLIGITSFSNGCGSKIPAIYTKVDEFFDWIELNILKLDEDIGK